MPNTSRNVLIICATVMFLSVIGAIVTIDRYVSGDSALTLAGIMVTLLGATITGLAALFKVDGLKSSLGTVNDKQDALLNGALTHKIRTEVIPVVKEAVKSEVATLLIQQSIVNHPDDKPNKKP